MALYIEIKANNHIVDVVAARRIERDPAEVNTYAIIKYVEFAPNTFVKRNEPVATIKHRMDDGALVLAEKAIHAVNNT